MVIVYYFHFRRHSFWFSSCFFLFFATHFAHFRTTFSNGRSYICPFNTKKLGCFLSPSGGSLKKCFTAVFPPPSSSSLFVKSNAQSPNLLNFYLCGGGGDCMSLRRTSCCQEDISYVCNNNNIKTGYTSLEKLMPLMRETKQKNHTISTCICFSQNDIRSRQGSWVLFISSKCD